MPEYNIKISELDPIYSGSILTEDFFPLVHSQSMTTFRATLRDIGLLPTHSIYSDTASYIANATHATSASHADWADTSSYAISASHALLADSASYYPPQQFQTSTLYASRSHDALYATRALDVDTGGQQYNFPFWTTWYTPGAGNGDLAQTSPLVYYPVSGYPLITVDSASTHRSYYQPYPNHRPDLLYYQFGERANVAWGFAPNIGIQSIWPITSQTFVGTDQRDYYFSTASNPHPPFDPDLMVTNSYFSGSDGGGTSGSFYTIPNAPGALASIFNGKWVRIAGNWGNPVGYDDSILPGTNPGVATHPAKGAMWSNPDQIMKGLISLQLQTTVYTGGSNAWNQIDFWFHQGQWGAGISAQVFHVNTYGPQLIRAIRFHSTNGINDPSMFIDILIDGLYSGGEAPGYQGEPVLTIKGQSWQGVRFLKWLNVDPWPLQDTGSSDPTQDGTTLIIPAAPGFYSNVSKNMNYYIQGKNVVIWPNYSQITQSGAAVQAMASTQSLFVSGGINTNTAFYCDNNKGLTTKVTYGTTNLYFSGGILINKYPPDSYVPPAGIPCGTSLKYNGGQSMPNEQIFTLGSDTGPVIMHFDAYANPDRLQVWLDGAVVYDTGYRGDPADKSIRDAGLTAAGSGSETSSPIISPGQTTFSWYKGSATTTAKVQVFAPGAGTAWNYTMSCPNQPLPT
jgi:hypothetical protein